MDELDRKLSLIIEDIQNPAVRNRVLKEGELTSLEEIKQAFIDAGWFIPADAELVQQVVNYRAQQKVDSVKHVADFSHGKLSALMTGQEWYDKFAKELKLETGQQLATVNDVLDAAKKAAGIK